MVQPATDDTAATLARHIEAILSGDVDAVLRNFSDESVVFTPDGLVRGLAAIRKDTEAFFSNSPPEMLDSLEIVRKEVDGEVAYLLWKAEPFVALAAETFVIRSGKIVAQTFAVLAGEGLAA
jgi:ketosteroid isomerase-like protein